MTGTIADMRKRACDAADALGGIDPLDALDTARQLVLTLRDLRQFDLMSTLAEAVSRVDPQDARNRRLYGQALIENGKASAAIDVLESLTCRLPISDAEAVEAAGLLGRAYKQIFFDARNRTTSGARNALTQAIASYRRPFEADARNTWHGINLLALVANSARLGIDAPADLNSKSIAHKVVQSLQAIAPSQRNAWYLPTLAEAQLGLDDWTAVESTLREYVTQSQPQAFPLAGLLRQFTQVWDIESTPRGAGLVSLLNAALMKLPGGVCEIQISDLQQAQDVQPMPGQLEAILGQHGAETYQWWKTGLTRALSVASIRQRLGSRIGTGFLVRAGDLGLAPADELVVLTNYHVVNDKAESPGLPPDQVEVVFEAADPGTRCAVEKILWCSRPDVCDACVLKLAAPVKDIAPLPIARRLPTLGEGAQVYVVGYPGGRDLSFSFQDNELLDHEGPPGGHPQIPGVCRIHYHAPTEGGSSGSPVFNSTLWEVIGLHHKGGKTGMPHLNGGTGTYAANEGIWLQSIAAYRKD
jgi:S1-C subfamily serine protease